MITVIGTLVLLALSISAISLLGIFIVLVHIRKALKQRSAVRAVYSSGDLLRVLSRVAMTVHLPGGGRLNEVTDFKQWLGELADSEDREAAA